LCEKCRRESERGEIFLDQFTIDEDFFLPMLLEASGEKHRREQTASGSSLDGANGEIVCVYFSREQTSVKFLPPLYRSPKGVQDSEGWEEERERKTGKLFAPFFIILPTAFHSLPLFN
jgi:hypothetical protein